MNIISIIVSLLAFIIALFFIYAIYKKMQNGHFRKNICIGVKCKTILNNEKLKGYVHTTFDNSVIFIDQNRNIHPIYIKNLYV